MIISLLFAIGGVILGIFNYAFATLNYNFPTQINTAFQTFFDLLRFWTTFLPFANDILAIIIILVPTMVIRYTIDIFIWIMRLIPFIGRYISYPNSNLNISRSSVTTTQVGRAKPITTTKQSTEIVRRNKSSRQS